MTTDSLISRRSVLALSAGTILIGILHCRSAWAKGRPEVMTQWARHLVALKDALRAGKIDVTQWQDQIETLNSSVPLQELIDYLDLDRLSAAFRYPPLLADVADPILPPEVIGSGGMDGWFIRMFGMRRGGAIIPHVHNNMVSAHLVVSGSFHARTHDRLRDLDDAVLLRPRLNAIARPGHVLSMSDRRDNQHWLIAREDRSITFDVGVVGLPSSWQYGLAANSYNMIFVDPDRRPERNGNIIAPILTFDQAQARFAA